MEKSFLEEFSTKAKYSNIGPTLEKWGKVPEIEISIWEKTEK